MWQSFKLYLSRIIKWTTVTGSSASGGRTFLETDAVAIDEDQDSATPIAGVARLFQHFGFRSRPPVGCEQIQVLCRGSKEQPIIVATDSPTWGPAALQEGEVEIYSKVTGTSILLDKDGQVIVTANGSTVKISTDGKVTIDAATGKDVVVNGGSLQVARATDPVQLGNPLVLWMAQVEGALNALAAGTVTPVVSAFAANPGVTIKSGATHFKG